jgi:hypothetical protein
MANTGKRGSRPRHILSSAVVLGLLAILLAAVLVSSVQAGPRWPARLTTTTVARTTTTTVARTTSTVAPTTTSSTTTTTALVTPTATTSSTTTTSTTTTTLAATTTTTAATTTTAPAGVYNVLNYGAKGNGVSDDAPAVQAAVNAARAAGGGSVYLPAGTYRFYAARTLDPNLGANIELFDGVTVKGAGPNKTFVVAARSQASAFGAMRKKNISVQNMDISTTVSGLHDGVKFGVCTDVLVQNVVTHDIYIGVALYSCVNPVIRNCKAYNCSNAGLAIAQGATWPEVGVGGLIEDCDGWGANQYSFRLAGDYVGQKRVAGVTLRRCQSHDDRTGLLLTYAENLTLEDCSSTNTLYGGIRISGVNGAVLTRCSPAPLVSTAANDPDMFRVYGASSNIVVK